MHKAVRGLCPNYHAVLAHTAIRCVIAATSNGLRHTTAATGTAWQERVRASSVHMPEVGRPFSPRPAPASLTTATTRRRLPRWPQLLP